jgi:hypothetical protein
MQLEIKIENADRLRAAFQKMPGRIGTMIGEAIRASAFALEAASKDALTTGWTRAIRTGLLRSRTTVKEMSKFKATLYPDVFYGIYVHEGNKTMRPRPFLVEGIKRAESKLEGIWKQALSGI